MEVGWLASFAVPVTMVGIAVAFDLPSIAILILCSTIGFVVLSMLAIRRKAGRGKPIVSTVRSNSRSSTRRKRRLTYPELSPPPKPTFVGFEDNEFRYKKLQDVQVAMLLSNLLEHAGWESKQPNDGVNDGGDHETPSRAPQKRLPHDSLVKIASDNLRPWFTSDDAGVIYLLSFEGINISISKSSIAEAYAYAKDIVVPPSKMTTLPPNEPIEIVTTPVKDAEYGVIKYPSPANESSFESVDGMNNLRGSSTHKVEELHRSEVIPTITSTQPTPRASIIDKIGLVNSEYEKRVQESALRQSNFAAQLTLTRFVQQEDANTRERLRQLDAELNAHDTQAAQNHMAVEYSMEQYIQCHKVLVKARESLEAFRELVVKTETDSRLQIDGGADLIRKCNSVLNAKVKLINRQGSRHDWKAKLQECCKAEKNFAQLKKDFESMIAAKMPKKEVSPKPPPTTPPNTSNTNNTSDTTTTNNNNTNTTNNNNNNNTANNNNNNNNNPTTSVPATSAPSPKRATNKTTSVDTVEPKYAKLVKLATSLNDAVSAMQSTANTDPTKKLNGFINKITATKTQIHKMTGKIFELLDAFKQNPNPKLLTVALFRLAKSIVSRGSNKIPFDPTPDESDEAFVYGQVSLMLWERYPEFHDIFLGQCFKICPFTCPIIPKKSPIEDVESYLKSRGFLNGTLTKGDEWVQNSMSSIRLYAAFLQSSSNYCQNNTLMFANDCLVQAWQWLVRFTRITPEYGVSASVLKAFLEVAGHMLFQRFGRQFTKMLVFVQEIYFPKLDSLQPQLTLCSQPLASKMTNALKQLVKKAISTGAIPSSAKSMK